MLGMLTILVKSYLLFAKLRYHSKLAEEYGTDVASEILSRSRPNLEVMPTMPYAAPQSTYDAKYESLNTKSPGTPLSAL
jgi:hypothetical protein